MPTLPESPSPAPTHGLTRRGVVRTAAWSVPVITLVSAAPAFAASPPAATKFIYFDQDQAIWYPVAGRGMGSALAADMLVESDTPEFATPVLTLTITFPASWTAGGRTISMAHGREKSEWGGAWTPAQSEAGRGARAAGALLFSASGTFTFVHPAGVIGPEVGMPFAFTAWVEGIDLSTNLDPLGVALISDDTDWDITDGSVRAIPVQPLDTGGGVVT